MKDEVAVLGSPSLTVLNRIAVDVSSERTLLLLVVIYLQFKKKKEMYSMVLSQKSTACNKIINARE